LAQILIPPARTKSRIPLSWEVADSLQFKKYAWFRFNSLAGAADPLQHFEGGVLRSAALSSGSAAAGRFCIYSNASQWWIWLSAGRWEYENAPVVSF